MFTCPDIFPDGRTGYDLTRHERIMVRAVYKMCRRCYSRDISSSKCQATAIARIYHNSTTTET